MIESSPASSVTPRSTACSRSIPRPLKPPVSYFASSGKIIRGTAGSPFNGIIATIHSGKIAGLADAVATYVNWGDGTPLDSMPVFLNPIGHGAFQVRSVLGSPGRKTFSFAGRYRIRSRAHASSGKTVVLRRTAVMSPAPLNVAGGRVTARSGTRTSMVVAALTDSGTALSAGSYSARIHWGDGTVSAGAITAQISTPGFLVSGAAQIPELRREANHRERRARNAWPGGPTPFIARTIAAVEPSLGNRGIIPDAAARYVCKVGPMARPVKLSNRESGSRTTG